MNKVMILIGICSLLVIAGCTKNYNADIVCDTLCDGKAIKHTTEWFPFKENIVCTTGDTNISYLNERDLRLECVS